MIQERIEQIASKVQDAATLSESAKADLLGLLSALKSEVDELATARRADAENVAQFAEASTQEAIRAEQEPEQLNAAIHGLRATAEGLEATHPKLTDLLNRIATTLANMGI